MKLKLFTATLLVAWAVTIELSVVAFEPKSECRQLKLFLRIKPWYWVTNFLLREGYDDLVHNSNIIGQISDKTMTKEALDATIMQALGNHYSADMRKTLSTKIRTSPEVSLVFYSKENSNEM